MIHRIPLANWPQALAETIEDAASGDTIEVDTEAKADLGERARRRMCPKKAITFTIKGSGDHA